MGMLPVSNHENTYANILWSKDKAKHGFIKNQNLKKTKEGDVAFNNNGLTFNYNSLSQYK